MKLNVKNILIFLSLIGVVFIFTSCATQPTPVAYDPPGFILGLLHGFIMLFSFIGSVFMDVRMYAFPNTGIMYDFGYLIGASIFLGGSGASSR